MATFDSNEKAEDQRLEQNTLDQGTEIFWQQLLPEAYEAARAAKRLKGSKVADSPQDDGPIGRRRRTRIDYTEIRNISDDEGAGATKNGENRKVACLNEAAAPSARHVESDDDSNGQWTELELKHLEERMMSLGRSPSRASKPASCSVLPLL